MNWVILVSVNDMAPKVCKFEKLLFRLLHIDGILPKGPYPPWLRMADRALLAGYPRYIIGHHNKCMQTKADGHHHISTNTLCASYTNVKHHWQWTSSKLAVEIIYGDGTALSYREPVFLPPPPPPTPTPTPNPQPPQPPTPQPPTPTPTPNPQPHAIGKKRSINLYMHSWFRNWSEL